jgi:hypothetical protein
MLLFEWECPYCEKKFYSSYPERNKETVECCYCNQEVKNPFCDQHIEPPDEGNI